ncbi:hypothetical protein FKM82_018309 [Ascaphus truei]
MRVLGHLSCLSRRQTGCWGTKPSPCTLGLEKLGAVVFHVPCLVAPEATAFMDELVLVGTVAGRPELALVRAGLAVGAAKALQG